MRHAAQYRQIMLDALAPYVKYPLFLSGGIDSATNLAAILAQGKKPPHAYTFHVEGVLSPDSRIAIQMCHHFEVPHTLVTLPRNEETLVTDIRRVLRITGEPRKTHVQCCHPWLYLAPECVGDGFRNATWAMAADNLWGTLGRHFNVGYMREGEEWARTERRKRLLDPMESDWNIKKVAETFGLTIHEPWHTPSVVEFLLSLKMTEMHKPFEKALALHAFPEFWSQGNWRRVGSSLQINSGLREWHDTLLSSQYNVTHAKAVVVLYRHFLADLKQPS